MYMKCKKVIGLSYVRKKQFVRLLGYHTSVNKTTGAQPKICKFVFLFQFPRPNTTSQQTTFNISPPYPTYKELQKKSDVILTKLV